MEELLDALDDLEDGISYVRELVQNLFWDQVEFVDDCNEEEDEQPTQQAAEEKTEETKEEK